MKWIFTCFLALTFCTCFSQEPGILVKFSPIPLIDEYNFPAIQAGLECRMSQRWSLYNELGIKYRKSLMDDSDTMFVKSGALTGINFKTEARYYLQAHAKPPYTGFYLAANVFFTRDNHNTGISFYHGNPTTNFQNDDFGVRKTTFGSNLLVGFQKYNRRPKGLGIEFYAGFGFRVRIMETTGQQYDPRTDYLYHSVDVNLPNLRDGVDSNPGTFAVPNFTTGFRVFYRF